MKINKNSNLYVIVFVFIVTLVCGFIIAMSAVVLKPAQERQVLNNLQTNVLKVAKIPVPAGSTLEDTFNKYISTAYVDLYTGQFYNAPKELMENYDSVLVDSKLSKYVEHIPGDQNLPGLKGDQYAWVQKVYLVKQNNLVSKVILPFYGNGLWSVMYGFLAVQSNGNTIAGITYYQQGETPGLGGRVETPQFTEQFIGKLIYKDDNFSMPAIELVKNANPTNLYRVSALTGATLTSNGVNNQLRFWLGPHGYSKFLDNIHSGKVSLDQGLKAEGGQ